MDCPKCVGKLQKKMIEDIEVDSCFVCEGIWFDAKELESILKADSKDFKFDEIDQEEFDGKEAIEMGLRGELDEAMGKCPRCEDGTLLVKTKYKSNKPITVDVCPKGHGVWLDGGEIQLLRERGLVKLYDLLDSFRDFLKYIFSREGLEDLWRLSQEKRRGPNKK